MNHCVDSFGAVRFSLCTQTRFRCGWGKVEPRPNWLSIGIFRDFFSANHLAVTGTYTKQKYRNNRNIQTTKINLFKLSMQYRTSGQ